MSASNPPISWLLFSQASPAHPERAAERDLRRFAEAARWAGVTVVPTPLVFDRFTAEELISAVADPQGKSACFSGYLDNPDLYPELFQAGRAAGITFTNTPPQSQLALDFASFYPLITELTPKSVVIRSIADLDQAALLGFPLFIKGAIKSAKEYGWSACTVTDRESLARAWRTASGHSGLLGQYLVARTIAPLRRSGERINDFPTAREYRCLTYQQQLLGVGYYWDGPDPFGLLSAMDNHALKHLTLSAAHQLDTPLLAVDCAQLDSGEWIVVEVGDPQFSGFSHIPHQLFWQQLLGQSPLDLM